MRKKFMAILMCAFMAFAVAFLGQSAHAAPPEGKGHGNSKEKMVKPQERGDKSKGTHGRQDRDRQDKQDRDRQDKQDRDRHDKQDRDRHDKQDRDRHDKQDKHGKQDRRDKQDNHGRQDRHDKQDSYGKQDRHDKQDNYGKHDRRDKQGDGPGRADEGGLRSPGITAPAARDLAMGGKHTGYKALPPGIAKNLARGKPLPPGIAKKAVPAGMLKELPVHPGYEWQVAGRDLVLVQEDTQMIADVLRDVFH